MRERRRLAFVREGEEKRKETRVPNPNSAIYTKPGNELFEPLWALDIFRSGSYRVPASVNRLTDVFALEQLPRLIDINLGRHFKNDCLG